MESRITNNTKHKHTMSADQTYDNELRGSLFRNDRKEKDTHPDYTGTCQIDGVEYYMNAWFKEAKSGKKYFSFSFKPKDAPVQGNSVVITDDDDDGFPF
jgi:uncharacterized protein (DUF736 family)